MTEREEALERIAVFLYDRAIVLHGLALTHNLPFTVAAQRARMTREDIAELVNEAMP